MFSNRYKPQNHFLLSPEQKTTRIRIVKTKVRNVVKKIKEKDGLNIDLEMESLEEDLEDLNLRVSYKETLGADFEYINYRVDRLKTQVGELKRPLQLSSNKDDHSKPDKCSDVDNIDNASDSLSAFKSRTLLCVSSDFLIFCKVNPKKKNHNKLPTTALLNVVISLT